MVENYVSRLPTYESIIVHGIDSPFGWIAGFILAIVCISRMIPHWMIVGYFVIISRPVFVCISRYTSCFAEVGPCYLELYKSVICKLDVDLINVIVGIHPIVVCRITFDCSQ